MSIPPPDIGAICEAMLSAAEDVLDAFDAAMATPEEVTPELLHQAIRQLGEILKRADADFERYQLGATGSDYDEPRTGAPARIAAADISELGEYGTGLLTDLGAWAERLGLEAVRRDLERLAFPLALWVARHGGELRNLPPVVNALASHANATEDPEALEHLCQATAELVQAVAPAIRADLEKHDPERPWRALNFNYGIVATRSHNPALMEQCFRTLTANLPEDAPDFFREGMAQMDALDYPAPVRAVMERFFKHWCGANHVLH